MSNEQVQREKRYRLLQSGFLFVALLIVAGRAAGVFFGPLFAALLLAVVAISGVTALRRQKTVLPAGSRELSRFESPDLHATVDRLSRRAGLARAPAIVYVPSSIPNAAATIHGERELIIVTDALLRRLDYRQLTGVLAHEISHISNSDLPLFAVVAALQGAVHLLANAAFFAMLFFLPLMLLGGFATPLSTVVFLFFVSALAGFIQLAILRTREFQADITAAELTGDPAGLAAALQRLEMRQFSIFDLFVGSRRQVVSPLFRTHPETEERVQRLLRLEAPATPLRGVTGM